MSLSLVAMSASTRRESFNSRVLRTMIDGAERAGADVTLINPDDYEMPLYNGDIEATEGLPRNVERLQEVFAAHDGFLLASPEYNGFFTPLLKNTLDWVSRPMPQHDGKSGSANFRGKAAGIVSASPGALGGVRSLQHTRLYLSNLGFIVVPDQVGVPRAGEAFDEHGQLKDERLRKAVENVGAAVARVAAQLRHA